MLQRHALGTTGSLLLVAALIGLVGCGGGGGGGGGGGTDPVDDPPNVSVSAPASDITVGLTSGDTVTVTYVDESSDAAGTTSVFADGDGDLSTTADQVVIELDRAVQSGQTQSLTWNVAGAPAGTYRIIARTVDANGTATATAPGRVTLDSPPTLTIVTPAGDSDAELGDVVKVEFTDEDDTASTCSIYADGDGDVATTGDQYLIGQSDPSSGGAVQTLNWHTAGMVVGYYWLLGVTTDGINPEVVGRSTGRVLVGSRAWRAGSPTQDLAEGVVALPDGSCIVVGSFESGADFDHGATTIPTAGGSDVFVARYGPGGTFSWVKSAGGTGQDEAYGVAGLADGGVIVTGAYNANATFGSGETNQTTLAASGANGDVFVARYAADGTLAWATSATSTGHASGWGVATFSDGSSVVTGRFEGSLTVAPGAPEQVTLVSSGVSDVFVARYAADGTLSWARRDGSSDHDYGIAVTSFSDGTCAVTGHFRDKTVFGAGETNETTLTAPSATHDMFLARYTADGSLAWATRAGGSEPDYGFGIASHADGSMVVTGRFYGTVVFGELETNETTLVAPLRYAMFVARYNDDGTLAWARQSDGDGSETGWAVATLADGSCAVAGEFAGTATLGPDEAAETSLTSSGGLDVLVARYTADGDLVWAKRGGGAGADVGRAVAATSESCFTVGVFLGTATFEVGCCDMKTLVSTGGAEAFVMRNRTVLTP